jgi:hypothetical protein
LPVAVFSCAIGNARRVVQVPLGDGENACRHGGGEQAVCRVVGVL